jgi:hypothetical protein
LKKSPLSILEFVLVSRWPLFFYQKKILNI